MTGQYVPIVTSWYNEIIEVVGGILFDFLKSLDCFVKSTCYTFLETSTFEESKLRCFQFFFRTLVYFTDQNKKWLKITKTSITQRLLLVELWNLVQTSGPLYYIILQSFNLIRQTVCILQTKSEIQTLVCKIHIFQSNLFKLWILKVIDIIQLWSKFGNISMTTSRVMDRSVNYNFTPFSRVIFTKTCNITSHEKTNLA